jgi:hypothetical protein
MPLPKLSTDPRRSRETSVDLRTLADHIGRLEARIGTLEAQIRAQPPILTLDQINTGLSAAGARPLNLAGLVGSTGTPL